MAKHQAKHLKPKTKPGKTWKLLVILAAVLAGVFILTLGGAAVFAACRAGSYDPPVASSFSAEELEEPQPETVAAEESSEPEVTAPAGETAESAGTPEESGEPAEETAETVSAGEDPDAEAPAEETELPYRSECFTLDEATGRVTYSDEDYLTLTGVDVSAYQGKIDWEKVAADGIDFALIRVGYRGYETGLLSEDERFVRNYDKAKEAGLQVGVYFYSQAVTIEEAVEEAEYTLSLLDGRVPDLPVFIDWERGNSENARTLHADGFMIAAACRSFCETVSAAGLEAGSYLNRQLLDNEVEQVLMGDGVIWMAQYMLPPNCETAYTFWQYGCDGVVDGISGAVDMNLWFISRSDGSTS